MSRRRPSFSDLNVRSEQQPIKRFKTSPTSTNPLSFRNIFEQFDDVPPSPTISTTTVPIPKSIMPKLSSQQSSSTSSSTARSIMAKSTIKQNDELWSTLFAPITRDDLILHPRKIKDFEEILQRSCEITKSSKRSPKLLLISGPPGSGKSTCLRMLAASLNINIVEWETRTTSTLTSTILDEQRDDRQWAESQKRTFRTFLLQSSRYLTSSTGNNNGLIFENETDSQTPSSSSSNVGKQLVLVEDLPNGFYSDMVTFHSTLRELKRLAHHPIAFVLTDNSSLSAAQNPHLLFPLSIIDELQIEQISFNPIAPTYMKKALESIIYHATKMKLKPPSRDCIADIILTANGDLRLAINSLQFSSSSKTKTSTTVRAKDTCISLFQALGRILYKKDSEENSNADEQKIQPENLIQQCHISAPTFVGFLFENYIDFYSSIDDAARLCDHLSLTEQLLNEWETRSQLIDVSSSIACRAVRLCNSMPTSRGFKPMRKPQDNGMKVKAQNNRTTLMTHKLYYGCSEEEYFTVVLPYQACLLKSTRSSMTNATNRSILDVGFIDRYSKKWQDPNSMVTEKNKATGLLLDHEDDSTGVNSLSFTLLNGSVKMNKLEYDDNVEIDESDD